MRPTLPMLATLLAAVVSAHPERHDHNVPSHELVSRSSTNCASVIQERKLKALHRRAERVSALHRRRDSEDQDIRHFSSIKSKGNHGFKYNNVQNDTCVLAPDTVWGPYGVDGEIVRHDVRETQQGIDLYLDIGVIDIETCEPLPEVALTIWACNATGSYSSFTGIGPDTAELIDGYTKRDDGTTDDETFLRGIQSTDSEGMAEFLTIFPGYYVSRTTHIHVTAQADITNGTSYSNSSVQHIGQLFFAEDVLSTVYSVEPYAAHLLTQNRTTNAADPLYSTANSDGYSANVDIAYLSDDVNDGILGYITLGINSSAAGLATSGGSVNPVGVIPTVSVAESKRTQATAIDSMDGYF